MQESMTCVLFYIISFSLRFYISVHISIFFSRSIPSLRAAGSRIWATSEGEGLGLEVNLQVSSVTVNCIKYYSYDVIFDLLFY